jgi:peptidoglycan pentaglycine glycine transferase (the first glycine)
MVHECGGRRTTSLGISPAVVVGLTVFRLLIFVHDPGETDAWSRGSSWLARLSRRGREPTGAANVNVSKQANVTPDIARLISESATTSLSSILIEPETASDVVLQSNEWDAAVQSLEGSPVQGWRWGDLFERNGFPVERLRIEGDAGIALAQVVFDYRGDTILAHIPRGPIIRGSSEILAEELFDAIQKICLERNAVHLTVEPDEQLPWPDIYERLGFSPGANHWNPVRTVKVPLLDDQRLLDQMRLTRRRQVRLGQRRGVSISSASADSTALATFYELLQDTGERNQFPIEPYAYYEGFMETFGQDAALLLGLLNGEVLGGVIILRYGAEMIYMFGASSTVHRVSGSSSYLMYEAMRWGRDHGCSRCDLWGIPAEDPLPNVGQGPSGSQGGDWSGMYHFKVSFGGSIVTYPPTLERAN